jgi:hypothetical protein
MACARDSRTRLCDAGDLPLQTYSKSDLQDSPREYSNSYSSAGKGAAAVAHLTQARAILFVFRVGKSPAKDVSPAT